MTTFKEAIKEVKEHDFTYDETSGTMQTFSVLDIIEELQYKYAPTIEMTKYQYLFIKSKYGKENVVYAVAYVMDNILREEFDDKFWSPLTQRDVVQAWLHPETIKVVGE